MTTPQTDLTALVKKWRDEAADYPAATDVRAFAAAVAVRLCANELEAALAGAETPQGVTMLDGPRAKTPLDDQIVRALEVIHQQRQEIERLQAAPPPAVDPPALVADLEREIAALLPRDSSQYAHGFDMGVAWLLDRVKERTPDAAAPPVAAPAVEEVPTANHTDSWTELVSTMIVTTNGARVEG